MQGLVRVILAAVLTLAIPLQGLAASTLALCAAGHVAAAAAPVEGMAHGHGSRLAAQDDAHHGVRSHGDRQHAAVAAQVDTSPSEATHADAAPASKAKCSVCASCGAAAAIPSAGLVLDSAAPTEYFGPTASSSPPAFLTAGLDRPPRPVLA
jgi:hypothetical protein